MNSINIIPKYNINLINKSNREYTNTLIKFKILIILLLQFDFKYNYIKIVSLKTFISFIIFAFIETIIETYYLSKFILFWQNKQLQKYKKETSINNYKKDSKPVKLFEEDYHLTYNCFKISFNSNLYTFVIIIILYICINWYLFYVILYAIYIITHKTVTQAFCYILIWGITIVCRVFIPNTLYSIHGANIYQTYKLKLAWNRPFSSFSRERRLF